MEHSRDGGKRALSDIVFWPIHIIYILQYRMYDWNEMLYTIEEMYWTVNLIYLLKFGKDDIIGSHNSDLPILDIGKRTSMGG